MSDIPFEDQLAIAISESLAGIDGLQESPYMLPNSTMPAAEVISGLLDFDSAFDRGTDTYMFTVRITVGTTVSENAQKWVRKLRGRGGPDSVKEALEADRTFGGLADDSHVTRASAIRLFQKPNAGAVLGCDFELMVIASGKD